MAMKSLRCARARVAKDEAEGDEESRQGERVEVFASRLTSASDDECERVYARTRLVLLILGDPGRF